MISDEVVSTPTVGPAVADLLTRVLGPNSGEPVQSGALTGPRQPGQLTIADGQPVRRVDIGPIGLRGHPYFQFAYHAQNKVTHRNLLPGDAAVLTTELLAEHFTQALLLTSAARYHLSRTPSGSWSVRRQTMAEAAPAPTSASTTDGHNRRKLYILPEGDPIPFLIRLGVMTADGRVITARYDKFRQINRFLEMVADIEGDLPEGPLHVVDFGSGKSALTFALYHYLHLTRGRDVTIVGLDLKADVIQGCSRIAQDLGWANRLTFEVGDIAGYAETASGENRIVDMVVSLHACDTATDDALARAVAWKASVILSVPCCQHELFRQIDNPVMRPLLKHGVLKERLAALLTDALRAELLERAGYQVQVMEFIDIEHTPKNLMLRAVRRSGDDPARCEQAALDYAGMRDFWHVSPHLEGALDAL